MVEHGLNEKEKFKYIDDLVEAEALPLSDLIPIRNEMEKPLEFRDRTLHEYPNEKSELQKRFY